MLQKTKNLPISVYFLVSSCVPATPFDESAFTINSKETSKCFDLDDKRILGLAEMMNYPGVISGDSEVLAKIQEAKRRNKRVDGHAPGLTGKDLEKYIAAGIESDHECTTLEEAIEKIDVARRLSKDFFVMIRQGTAARNLKSLVNLLKMPKYINNLMFCTDDKHPEELEKEGHIDYIIKKSIEYGVKPEDAYTVATFGAANYFGLNNMGRIEKDAEADIIILNDIEKVSIESVYKSGELITKEKLREWPKNDVEIQLEQKVKNSINMSEVTKEDIIQKEKLAQVIGIKPGELITTDEGTTTSYNLDKDIIKVVVIESHKGTMHTGIA